MKKKLLVAGFWVLVVLVVFTGCGMFGPIISLGNASVLTFDANGGIGTVLDRQTVEKGASFTLPGGEGLSFGDAAFVGWYSYSDDGIVTNYSAEESFTPPGGYISLFAKWEIKGNNFNSVSGFANKLAWLLNNAENGQSYTFELNANENIGAQSLRYLGKDNITILLRGVGGNRTISSAAGDKLFDVYRGVTLVLDNNITLQGHSDNKRELVWVGGRLQMNNGSSITGNGGVGVFVRGTFDMNGGAISGNLKNSGASTGGMSAGGVNVGARGTFTMNGGTISDNGGNGVFIWNDATFVMNNGSITGNTGSSVNQIKGDPLRPYVTAGNGGGVCVYDSSSTFTMNNGTISGNSGGGVLVEGTFTMNGGTITRNTSRYSGGGVYVWERATFRRIGGTVSGNTPDDIQTHPDNR